MKNALCKSSTTDYTTYLKGLSMTMLIEVWENLDNEPMIKDWIMTELEERDPAAFNSWMDADYDEEHPETYEPRFYFLPKKEPIKTLYSLDEVTILEVPPHVSQKKLEWSLDCGDLLYDIKPHPVKGFLGFIDELGAWIHFDI